MKKVLLTVLTSVMLLTLPVTTVHASSLDDVVNSTTQESNEATVGQNNEPSSNTSTSSSQSSSSYTSADEYIENTKNAADLTTVDTAGADKVNDGIRTVAAFIVRILSYFLTAFLVVRVILDLVYIALPFTRSILSNGYAGNPAAGGSGMGMQQPGMGGMGMGAGMGGMGMGGMGGMGGYGMRGGYGMNRMGMGGMGGMGMQQGQMGASPAMGRVQWVSSAALNAVAAEQMPGPDGKPQSALKAYAKDMMVVLIITPVLLTLAITGVLTNLGFLIGDVIAKGITSIGGMI
jgi:hypothetical protein